MQASELLALFGDAVSDPNSTTWPEPTRLSYLNQALLSVALMRPDASELTAPLQMVAGSKQKLPADGLRLLSIFRNTNASGASNGPAVRHIERMALDDVMESWLQEARSETVHEYWYDERAPKQFWTNPVIAGIYVEISYSRVPPTVASPDDDIPMDDVFAPPLREWMLYLAWGRDALESPTYARAQAHRANCLNMLGIKEQADAKSSPKASGA